MVLESIVNNPISCNSGYDDFTTMSTSLNRGVQYNMTVQTGYNTTTEMASMWIDLNDNGTFDSNEQIFANQVINPDGIDITIPFTIPATANLGSHRMRLRCGDTQFSGDLNNPCDPMDYGTTHDYTVIVTDSTSAINEEILKNSTMLIKTLGDKQYDISLKTAYSGPLSIAIYNAEGKILAFNNLRKSGKSYNYHLDMSYAASGVYIIKMSTGSTNVFKTEKIIIK